MRFNSFLALMMGVFLAPAFSAAAGADLELSRDGKARAWIVVAEEATEPERTAAGELQKFLKQVTGGEFALAPEASAAPDAARIYVGQSAVVRALLPGVDWKALGADGIVMKTVGGDLVLAGGRPRGTLYAVYTFLEDVVGCRWWTSIESDIPSKPNLKIPPLERVYAPALQSRETYFADVMGGEPRRYQFAARLKLNGHHMGLPAAWGGHHQILGFVHTFYRLLPPAKYFKEHPEWYSLRGGKRTHERAQLCLTNAEMRRELTKNALAWMRGTPDAGMISVSQNDCHGACECDACQALVKTEGSEAGPLLHFVNAVAADVEKEFPAFMVETLAYQYTRQPPLGVRPRRNVVVRLCSIEGNFLQPFDAPASREIEVNRTFRADVEGWAKIAPHIYVWDYTVNFRHYLYPHPNLHVLGPNIRFFVKNKSYGLFEQGDGYGLGEFSPLKAWLIGHLLWEPSRDPEQLLDEFLRGYYGPAGPHIREYIDLLRRAFEREGTPMGCYNNDLSALGAKEMATATQAFERALAAAGERADLARRVRQARLPLDLTWLVRHQDLQAEASYRKLPFAGPKDRRKALADFKKALAEFGVTHPRENGPTEQYLKEVEGFIDRPAAVLPAAVPKECRELAAADWLDIQDGMFSLYRYGALTKCVADPRASDQRAVWMPGNVPDWAVQYHPRQEQGRFRVYVAVRCEAEGDSGPGFSLGVHDPNGTSAHLPINLDQAGDGKYRNYDLGVHDLTGKYIWVAPPKRAEVKAVYVDRIFLIRQK